MIKHYLFATYNIKNRFISHTSKGEFSVVFLKENRERMKENDRRLTAAFADAEKEELMRLLNRLYQHMMEENV